MPKGSAKETRKYYFSIGGKGYGIEIPSWYSEEDALAAADFALKEGIATPVRKTADVEDRTPFEVPPNYRTVGQYQTQPDRIVGPDNEDEIEFAKRGIESNKYFRHFSLEDTTAISSVPNENYAAAAIGNILKKKWEADDVDPEDLVTKDPESGELLYLDYRTKGNPRGTNRWVRYQGKGPWDLAKGAAGVAGYIAGAAPGLMTGNPGGMAIGGAIGSGLAAGGMEYVRQRYGVNEGLVPEEESWAGYDATKEGLIMGGASLTTDTAMRVFTRPGRINSYFFDKKYQDEFEKGMANTEETVKRINELDRQYGGPGTRYDPSPAQRSNVRELRDLEATIEAKQSTKSSGGYSEGIKKRRAEAERAVNNVLDNLLGAPEDDVNYITGQVGREVKDTVEGQYVPRMERELARQGEIKEQVGAFADEAGGVDAQAAVTRLREAAEGSLEAAKADKDALWAKVDEEIGVTWKQTPSSKPRVRGGEFVTTPAPEFEAVDQYFVKIDPTDPAIRETALLWAKGKNGLFDQAAVERLGPQFMRLMDAVEKGEQIPLSKLIQGVKQLRSIERETLGATATSPFKMDQAFLVQLETGLQTIRDNYLKKNLPTAMGALKRAEEASEQLANTYYRTNGVKDLLRSVAGNPNEEFVGTEAVIRKILVPNDAGPARTLVSTIRNDAEALQGLRDLAFRHYSKQVINPRNGLVDPVKYRKFMADYGNVYKEILDPKDLERLNTVGGLGDAFKMSQMRYKAFEKQFKELFPSIKRLDAESIVPAILGKGKALNPFELTQLKALMATNPGLWSEVQNAAKISIRAGLEKHSGDVSTVVPGYINSLLQKSERLKMLFGEQYVNDLRTVLHAKSIIGREGTSINIPAQTPTLAMFRVIWGPLSRTQRFISASRQYQIAGYEQTLYNILSDPRKLRLAIARGNTPVGSDNAAPILAQLGIQFVEDDVEEGNVPPP